MKESIEIFEILIKNYDNINNKYFLGKQKIDTINYQKLEVLLKKLPFNSEKIAVPIQIITHDLIIEKKNKEIFTYEYNKPFPHNNICLSKKEFELNKFKEIFDNKEDKTVEYFKSFLYVITLLFVGAYFAKVNFESIFIFLGQDFGTITIKLFLIWLSLVSIGEFLYFLYDFIIKPFKLKYRIPLKYSKPSNYILKKNELNHFFLFSGQLIYLFILDYLYISYTNLIIIEDNLYTFFVFLIPGIIIAIHYLAVSVKLLISNKNIEKKLLTFSYALLQNSNIKREEQELNLKIVNDIVNSKKIAFGHITAIIGSLTLLLAIIPNISFSP